MGRRYKKRTIVSKDVFGRKVIETEWIPAGGGGCALVIGLILVYLLFFHGC
jgi:hypothetical protein